LPLCLRPLPHSQDGGFRRCACQRLSCGRKW
jgi:hypothetical protein